MAMFSNHFLSVTVDIIVVGGLTNCTQLMRIFVDKVDEEYGEI